MQGNLDPCVLFAPWPVVEARGAPDRWREGRAAPGHVFNLGHGVLPETDPEVLTRVVALVHELSAPPGRPGLSRRWRRPWRVAVVGGGIAGLAAAVRLRDRAPAGTEITVYEQSGALGGKLRTGELAGRPVEFGAESFLMRDPAGGESAAVALARRLGLADRIVHPTVGQAALVVDGGLRPIPGGTLVGVPGDLARGGDGRRARRRTPTATAAGRCSAPDAGRLGRARWSGPGSATRWSTGWSTRCSAGSTPAGPTTCPWPPPCRRWPAPPGWSTPWSARSGPRRPPRPARPAHRSSAPWPAG